MKKLYQPSYSKMLPILLILAALPLALYAMSQVQNLEQEAKPPSTREKNITAKAKKREVFLQRNEKPAFILSRKNSDLSYDEVVRYTIRSTVDETPKEAEAVIPKGQESVEVQLPIQNTNEDIAININNDESELDGSAKAVITVREDRKKLQQNPHKIRSVIVSLTTKDIDAVLKRHNIRPKGKYNAAINGFAAKIPQSKIEALQNDPQVISVEDDQITITQAQQISREMQRIAITSSPVVRVGSGATVDADIAIIDTGVDATHPDLNVVGGYACVPNVTTWTDDNGHGTKVAGMAAAKDNDIGMVGSAPGARIWSIKTADSTGFATWSNHICGIDWIIANKNTIEVANLSSVAGGGDGTCSSSTLHQAVCNLYNAGILLVVAGGNSGVDAATTVPATYEETLAVGSIADTDGRPGKLGANSSYGPDDSYATFSQWGPDIDIVAPGVNIFTTLRGGGYGGGNGTSYSSPIVAGAAAVYKSLNPTATPLQVKQALIQQAAIYNGPNGYIANRTNTTPPLVWLGISPNPTPGTTATPPSPTPTPTKTPTPSPSPTPSPTLTPPSPTPTKIPPTATTTPIKGDYNNDLNIDLLDFNLWRNEFMELLSTKKSDGNNDGIIDLLDFNIWLTAFRAQ
jgi:subtilisin